MTLRISKILIISVTAFFSLFQVLPHDTFASCIASSLQEQKENADIILFGRAEETNSDYTIVTVERYFKGHGGPSQIKVTGKESPESNTITPVDFQLGQGKKYLLFLKTHPSQVLRTNACMGNKEVNSSLTSDELAVLGSGYSPTSSETLNSTKVQEDKNDNKMQYTVGGLVGVTVLGALFILAKKRKA